MKIINEHQSVYLTFTLKGRFYSFQENKEFLLEVVKKLKSDGCESITVKVTDEKTVEMSVEEFVAMQGLTEATGKTTVNVEYN